MLNEGRVYELNKDILGDQKTIEVGNSIPKDTKVEDNTQYKEFVDLYKGVVDMKCMQEYGTLDDKDLWDDCAKELYIKSKAYLPLENNKSEGALDKKTESKLVKESNDSFPQYKLFGDWNVKISRDEKDGHLVVTFIDMTVDKNVFPEGQVTYSYDLDTLLGKDGLSISKPLKDMNEFKLDLDVPQWTIKGQTLKDIGNWLDTFEKYINTDKKTESVNNEFQVRKYPNEEEFKGMWGLYDVKNNKFIQKGPKYLMNATLKDYTNKNESVKNKQDLYTKWLNLVSMLSSDNLDEYMDTHDITPDMIEGKQKPDEDYLDELITDAEQYLFESKNLSSNTQQYKSGDIVDILDSYGKWLNSSDRIKYVIDRPATKDEIKGIWDIDTPCYIVKTVSMTDDTKFLNGTSKQPVTRLRLSKHIKTESKDTEYPYMLLDRLKTDCEYFLHNGNGSEKHLWAGSVKDQINKMKEIYNSLDEKPEWITLEDIDKYEKEMNKLLKSKLKESYYIKLFNKDSVDMDTIEADTEDEAIKIAEQNMNDGWRAVVYDNKNNEAIYDYNPFENTKTFNESKENDLSKHLYQDEANKRIMSRLANLDIFLEELQDAIDSNDKQMVDVTKYKIRANVEYLIPALNIKGGVQGLVDYLQNTDFKFENYFKQYAHLLLDTDIMKLELTENTDTDENILNNLVKFLNTNNITPENMDDNNMIVEEYLAKTKIGINSYIPTVYKVYKDDYGAIGRINFNKSANSWEFYTSSVKLESSRKLIEGTDKKRVARYRAFDNGRILYSWYNWTEDEAQEKAKQASIEHPDGIYYVDYDDIMSDGASYGWYKGEKVSWDSMNEIQNELDAKRRKATESKQPESNNAENNMEELYNDMRDILGPNSEYVKLSYKGKKINMILGKRSYSSDYVKFDAYYNLIIGYNLENGVVTYYTEAGDPDNYDYDTLSTYTSFKDLYKSIMSDLSSDKDEYIKHCEMIKQCMQIIKNKRYAINSLIRQGNSFNEFYNNAKDVGLDSYILNNYDVNNSDIKDVLEYIHYKLS